MAKLEKEELEEQDILDQMQDELNEIQTEEGKIDSEKVDEALNPNDSNTMDLLAKTMADFDNYKKRVERDREDMIFFLKSDILKTILPRIDDFERILNNTPEDLKTNPLYEGLESTLNKLLLDLSKLGVKAFKSIGEEVDPDKHEVITVVPSKDNTIIDEFEKGYTLNDKILRYAKVIAGAGQE